MTTEALRALVALRQTIRILDMVDGDLQADEWDEDISYYCKLLTESANAIEAALAKPAGEPRCDECEHPIHKGACMIQLGHDGHSTQWCNCAWWKLGFPAAAAEGKQ